MFDLDICRGLWSFWREFNPTAPVRAPQRGTGNTDREAGTYFQGQQRDKGKHGSRVHIQ